jgi:hypothetical protein
MKDITKLVWKEQNHAALIRDYYVYEENLLNLRIFALLMYNPSFIFYYLQC